MRKVFLFITILLSIVTLSVTYYFNRNRPVNLPSKVDAQSANDWPQLGKDPQHTAYSNETLGNNIKLAWRYAFQPDRVHPQVQAIVYLGKVLVGTEGANGQKPALYALDATVNQTSSGKVVWKYEVGGSILNAVAADNGMIFAASLDGAIYAIYSDTENGHTQGTLAWKKQISNRLGFYSAPLVADGKILIGGQDGNFYALNPSDGSILWQYKIGSPVLITAAYDQGKVFFGAMDLYVYALKTSDGSLVWKSQKLNGQIFKDFFPVVFQGKVLVRAYAKYPTDGITPGFPFMTIQGSTDPNYSWLTRWAPTLASGAATLVPDFMKAQDDVMASFNANPNNYSKNLYILDENTGQEAMIAPHWIYKNTIGGTVTLPCVDRDNYLIMPIGGIGEAGWGRMDLNYPTGPRLVDILYDGTITSTGNTWTWPDGTTAHQYVPGFNNQDENLTVSCAKNMVIAINPVLNGGLTASYSGGFNLDTRQWIHISEGLSPDPYGEMSGGPGLGGQNAATISNGVLYHIEVNTLYARSTN